MRSEYIVYVTYEGSDGVVVVLSDVDCPDEIACLMVEEFMSSTLGKRVFYKGDAKIDNMVVRWNVESAFILIREKSDFEDDADVIGVIIHKDKVIKHNLLSSPIKMRNFKEKYFRDSLLGA